jgi:hypothetical protein
MPYMVRCMSTVQSWTVDGRQLDQYALVHDLRSDVRSLVSLKHIDRSDVFKYVLTASSMSKRGSARHIPPKLFDSQVWGCLCFINFR